jgi:HicB-like protein involved in pilus formation
MELEPRVNSLHQQLEIAALAGGEEAEALAQRLTAPLEAAVRLMLLEVLSDAAAEITRELAPGSVEVRLRGRDPEFVVSTPLAEPTAAEQAPALVPEEGAVARINVRLPESLKSRVEQAAEREGLSINAWLVRVAANAVDRGEAGGGSTSLPRGGQGYTGWGR